jgi:hypothetical protein
MLHFFYKILGMPESEYSRLPFFSKYPFCDFRQGQAQPASIGRMMSLLTADLTDSDRQWPSFRRPELLLAGRTPVKDSNSHALGMPDSGGTVTPRWKRATGGRLGKLEPTRR